MRAPETYRQGRPSWIDLATGGLAGAMEFYRRLFGWDYEVEPSSGGGYYMARRDGDVVAGVAASQDPDYAARWSIYLAVDDAAAVAEKATAAGGAVLVPAMEVGPAGTMAFIADPGGAAIGLWQGATLGGAERINEPGAFSWVELHTADLDSAASFYNAIVGLRAEPADSAGDPPYTVFKVGDSAVAGAPALQPEVVDLWRVYFGVTDVDEACSATVAAGGEVVTRPADGAWARSATIRDPQGAILGIIASRE